LISEEAPGSRQSDETDVVIGQGEQEHGQASSRIMAAAAPKSASVSAQPRQHALPPSTPQRQDRQTAPPQ